MGYFLIVKIAPIGYKIPIKHDVIPSVKRRMLVSASEKSEKEKNRNNVPHPKKITVRRIMEVQV